MITKLLPAMLLAVGLAGPLAAEPAAWRSEGWMKTDFTRSAIAWSDILSGGPPKDGIPSIDKPSFRQVGEISDMAPQEPVIALDIAGDARAYPLRVLIWHEIVNDIVGAVPVSITYCPLCNSSIVFDRRVGDRVLDFGTTGKLRNSDLVMYDRQTESWWQQFTGEAIVGALMGSQLGLIPSRLESIADFRTRHPQGRVLVPAQASARPYGSNPYVGYDTSARPFLYKGDMPPGIEPMARVVVVRADRKKPLVISLSHLRQRGRLAIGPIELAWKPGQASAVDADRIAKGRDVGTVEVTLRQAGKPPELVPFDVTFAFVAHAFHPDVPIATE